MIVFCIRRIRIIPAHCGDRCRIIFCPSQRIQYIIRSKCISIAEHYILTKLKADMGIVGLFPFCRKTRSDRTILIITHQTIINLIHNDIVGNAIASARIHSIRLLLCCEGKSIFNGFCLSRCRCAFTGS